MEYPHEMRPERPIKFSEIMAISAKERADDIDQVKVALRHILDVADELEQKENDSAEILHQLKESMHEKGPRLV